MNYLNRNIIFIGFMGSGKSSVARAVAKKTSVLFVDTDDLIITSENKKIKDIFKDNSEAYFRECEKKVFDFLLPTRNICISVGGGFPIYIEQSLKPLGVVIYLKKSFNDIIASLSQKDIKDRPLLADFDKAIKIYNDRMKIYEEQADITVSITSQSIDKVCLDVISKLKI